MKDLKRFCLVLIFIIFMIYHSCYGFNNYFFELKEKIINEYILYEDNKSFYLMGDIVSFYLNSHTEMIKDFISEYGWYDRLKEEDILIGAYVRSGITSFTVGNNFLPEFKNQNQYYIDQDRCTHYVYTDSKGDVFSDTIIGFLPFRSFFENLRRIPAWVLLYDKSENVYSIIFSQNTEPPERIDLNKIITVKSPKFIGIRYVIFTKPLDLENSKLLLVAGYPFKLGEKAFLLIGLIVILIITILLLLFTGIFVFSGLKGFKKVNLVTPDRESGSDIISEIDMELSTAKETALESTQDTDKEGKIITEGVGTKLMKNLEYDGIRIKKA